MTIKTMTLKTVFIVGTLSLAYSGSVMAAPAASALVSRADELRMPNSPHLLVSMTLRAKSGARTEPAYSYKLRMRQGTGSLVEAIDGDQRGQKYLSTPNGYWLYAPRTQRALRLTPLQLVRGQASIGDISRMRFSTDYSATLAKDPDQTIDGVDCWQVNLKANTKQATYSQVALYVAKNDGRPVHANLYSAAGKKLKTILFGSLANVSGRKLVQSTTFVDGINASKSTVLTLQTIAQTETPELMFKPQALGRD